MIQEFYLGLKDSCRYLKTSQVLIQSKSAHKPIFFSFFLTGGVFLGSLLLFNVLLLLLQGYPKLEKTISKLYYIFWLFPIYLLCFIVNIFCYYDITSSVYQIVKGQPVSAALSFSRSLACEIHRGLMMGVYLGIMTLLSFIPYSDPLIICLMSWIYSFYCFEYRWVFEGKTIIKEIKTIESNAIYYLGFGVPFALITYSFPGFLGNGIWAMVFPIFSVTAILAEPPVEPSVSLPVFRLVHNLCDKIEVLLFNKHNS